MEAVDRTAEVDHRIVEALKGVVVTPDAWEALEKIDSGETDGVRCWRDKRVILSDHSQIEGRGLIVQGEIPDNCLIAIKQGRVVDREFVGAHQQLLKGSQQQIGPNHFLVGLTEEEVRNNLVGYNHRCRPNARILLIEGIALAFLISREPINVGVEVGTDYSITDDTAARIIEDCQCGDEELCRHYIDPPNDWKSPEFRSRYPNEFPWYMRHKIDALI